MEGAELMQPENQLSQNLPQNLPPQDLPPQQNQQNIDVNTLTLLLNLLQKVNSERGAKAKPKDFINVLESVLENAKEQENE